MKLHKIIMSKMIFRISVTVFLTFGLSLSLQSVIAAWTAPIAEAPDGNVSSPLYSEVDYGQWMNRGLVINLTQGDANGLAVYGNALVGDDSSPANMDISGDLRVRGLASCEMVNTDVNGNLSCETSSSCADGQILKRNGSSWGCADDDSGAATVPASSVTAGTFASGGDYTFSGNLIVDGDIDGRINNGGIQCDWAGWHVNYYCDSGSLKIIRETIYSPGGMRMYTDFVRGNLGCDPAFSVNKPYPGVDSVLVECKNYKISKIQIEMHIMQILVQPERLMDGSV